MRQNVLADARKFVSDLQPIPAAHSDLMVLLQAIKTGKPGFLADTLINLKRRWAKIVANRSRTVEANIILSRAKRENQEYNDKGLEIQVALEMQADPLFPIPAGYDAEAVGAFSSSEVADFFVDFQADPVMPDFTCDSMVVG